MWLLKTDCTELKYFSRPPTRYAILSHVWGSTEQSYQELRAIVSNEAPLSMVSAKIRDCCAYTAAQDHEWLWVDTCCIDKTSSAELSEAINSMYQWYASASVCYAYLQDVPAADNPSASGSAFRKSRWFTRGWTLQELLAPTHVHFLSQDWTWIGEKTMFAPLLEEVTGIDKRVLTSRVALASISVGERMRWASNRTTTRVEDQAYALMGIFGIHMSTIYGEGMRAFRRLQEEIMKQSSDHTLFTWGFSLPFRSTAEWSVDGISRAHHDLLASSPAMFNVRQKLHSEPKPLQASTVLQYSTAINAFSRLRAKTDYLAALRAIFRSSQRRDSPPWVLSQMPEVAVTGLGIRIRAPAIEIVDRTTPVTIALLMCTLPGSPFLTGLVLHRIPHSSLYGIGFTVRSRYFRYVHIDPSSPLWRAKGRWRGPAYQELYVVRPDALPVEAAIARMRRPPVRSRHYVFVPGWATARLQLQGPGKLLEVMSHGELQPLYTFSFSRQGHGREASFPIRIVILAALCSAHPYYEPRLAMEVVVTWFPQTSPTLCTHWQSSQAGDGSRGCRTPHVSEWPEVPRARARERGALGPMRVRRFRAEGTGTDAVVVVDLYVTNLSANYEDRHVWAIDVEVGEARSLSVSLQEPEGG